MQIYSSPEFFGDYHANFPLTRSHLSNGMRTRMSALHYALDMRVITDIKDARGDLLVEPFAVKPRGQEREALRENGWITSEWQAIEDKYAQEVCDYSNNKYLICSEMEILRWRGNLRKKILSTMRKVFTTCDYQKNLLTALGIPSARLPEPINSHLFYPNKKKPKQIVAIGSATYTKNTEMLIDFYRALEGTGYHRVYIGGPAVWGNIQDLMLEHSFRYNMNLYHTLKEVCDEFHEASPATTVARVLSESEFYANFAYHEVGCRTVLEALMCGCGILWGQHPLGNELPVVCMASDVDEAVTALEKNTGTIDVEALRTYAVKNYSFRSVKRALETALYDN